ncbi:hypothetical protein LR48_Vigan102s004800 [Vigna angularis]|uniref:Uncharacterized protein n=1 Tax=Phaseolus angularis TaxID=3914 RepID=A0A0L9T465_PHAAN|nr:hypothetical protein LR48_Vigan102s004800 [Vigna angularis]
MWTSVQTAAARPRLCIRTLDTQCGRAFKQQPLVLVFISERSTLNVDERSISRPFVLTLRKRTLDTQCGRAFNNQRFVLTLRIRTLDKPCERAFQHGYGRAFKQSAVRPRPLDSNARQSMLTSVQTVDRSASPTKTNARKSICERAFVNPFQRALVHPFQRALVHPFQRAFKKRSPTHVNERPNIARHSARLGPLDEQGDERSNDPRRSSTRSPTFIRSVINVRLGPPTQSAFGLNARQTKVNERPLSTSFGLNARHSMVNERPLSQSFGLNARHSIVNEHPLSQSFGLNARHLIVNERPLGQSFGLNARHSIVNERPLCQSFGLNARHSIVNERPLSQSFGLNARHSIVNERPHDRPRMPLGLYRSVIRILTFGLTCSSFLPFGFASFWSIKFNHSVTFNPHMSNNQEHAL